MTPAQRWHDAVRDRDKICAAEQHDRRCRLVGEHAHHIVFRSHITKEAMWLNDNGIWLSLVCHALAHRTHNMNLPQKRLVLAVDTVNAVMPAHLRRPYFAKLAA